MSSDNSQNTDSQDFRKPLKDNALSELTCHPVTDLSNGVSVLTIVCQMACFKGSQNKVLFSVETVPVRSTLSAFTTVNSNFQLHINSGRDIFVVAAPAVRKIKLRLGLSSMKTKQVKILSIL